VGDAPLDRRQFVIRAAAGAMAVALAGCGGSSPTATTVRRKVTPPRRASIADLSDEVRGRVVTPSSANYRKLAQVYNERFDGARPLAIVAARDEADVQAAVRWAGRREVSVVPRAGGHSYGGYSTGDGVLVVDLTDLDSISVDRGAGVARIGAGAQLIDVYSTLDRSGATTPAGSCPSVGIGGHAQVGGIGLAGRKFGLASDNIEGLRIVTADGAVRVADRSSDPDLYWACRGGGGGNFGIVTSFSSRVHPVSSAAYFNVSWPWSAAADALDAWQRFAPHAPDELTSIFHLVTGTESPAVSANGQWFGSASRLEGLLAPLTDVTGASVTTGTLPYLQLMLRWAGCSEAGLDACHTVGTSRGGTLPRARFLAKSNYVADPISAAGRKAAVAAIERHQAQSSGGSAALLFDSYGGAINRVPADATAFVHRDALCAIQYLAYFAHQADQPAARRWIDSAWSALRPHVSPMAYLGYIDPDLRDWETAYYGSNYPRLREVKAEYDPDFRFRFAQAIRPAA
jgi:FAD/FMN-containing dehydrogenase